MAIPVLALLCLLPCIHATPLDQGTSQSLSLPSLESTPLQRLNASALTHSDLGCFANKPWVTTSKADCEGALDVWVGGESLSIPRLFSRNPTSHMSHVRLPFQAWHASCTVYVNVVDPGDEEVITLGQVYAEVLGPDGLAKNCLGQRGIPAIGGKMTIGRKGVLKVILSGRKFSSASSS